MMNQKHTRRVVRHFRETLKNKLSAIALLIVGTIPVMIDGDGTALVFLGCIAIPMFFAKENWMIF